MAIKVWLYAFRAVALIVGTIHLPALKIGKYTQFKYSFWLFAVHYWLDEYLSGYVYRFFSIAPIYQVITWCIVVAIGLCVGIVLNKILPKVFNVLTGSRAAV